MIITITIFCVLFVHSTSQPNNVCEFPADYLTAQANPNCWYEEDVELEVPEIIERHGYPFKSYEIKTYDGYFITLFRIPNSGPPVLMEHSLAGDSAVWFLIGNESFPFLLHDNGYDVWLSNSRGTKYSARHETYTVYDREYWEFSFHEIGLYEVPAIIDHITSESNQTGQIVYIGHSFGTSMSFVYASLKPDHAKEHLKAIISFAPLAYMEHGGSPLVRVLILFAEVIRKALALVNVHGIGPNVQPVLDGMHEVCSASPTVLLCLGVHSQLDGMSGTPERYESFPVAFSKFPSGASLMTVVHYAQLMRQKPARFQYFDHGPAKNMKEYNSLIPPEYPVRKITVPVHLYYGTLDALAKEPDVYRLYEALTTDEKTIDRLEQYNHYNFLAADNSTELYQSVLKHLE